MTYTGGGLNSNPDTIYFPVIYEANDNNKC